MSCIKYATDEANMTEDQLRSILWKLKEMEWHFHYVDNGPDEYRCPGLCCAPMPGGKDPILEHEKDCEFKEVMDLIEKELKQIEGI